MEESCCSRMLTFADLLCIFRISPDIYFLPTLAGCFWCFLLVYKLNMIGSYPNELVCLRKISFKIRADLRLWIQSNKLSKLARFLCCKWVRDYSWTWATDESSNLIINPAIFLSGLGEVDFAVASVAVKSVYAKHQNVAHTRFTPKKIAILLESMQAVMGWPLLLEHEIRPTRISTKAPCVDLKNVTKLNSKKEAARMHHPKRS